MELQQVRYFVAVAEELHFRRAAECCNVAQPPLSRAIQALESELRVRLFDRDRRGVALTKAGEAFLEGARELLDLAERSAVAARNAVGVEAGRLRVAFPECANHGPIAAALGSFRVSHPQVRLEEFELEPPEALEALEKRRVDVAFAYGDLERPGLEVSRPVWRAGALLLVPRSHPLAARKTVPVRALEGETLMMLERSRNPAWFEAITGPLRTAGANTRIVTHRRAFSITKEVRLVSAGIGLAPTLIAHDSALAVTRPLSRPAVTLELFAVWRGDDRSSGLRAFVEVVHQHAEAGPSARATVSSAS